MFEHVSKRDSSGVILSSEVLAEKCQTALKRIARVRKERVAKSLESGRQEMMSKWLHRLLKKPVPTDQDVRDYLAHTRFCSPITWDERAYAGVEAVAERLLHASQQTDQVFVSTEDLYMLG